jgi:arylsulfatase A-like enzyme
VAAKQPDILLLHTDQQRFDTIRALGASHMDTPNLDRLIAMGTAFVRAYSSNPVCMPARHDLITGTSARRHGYYHNCWQPIADYALPTVPRLLSWAGYETWAIGKMHFAPVREHHGFDHMALMEELPISREQDEYLQYLDQVGYGHIRCQHGVRPIFYHSPQPALVPEEHHGSAWVADKTIDVLQTPRDRPVFIFTSWVGPHPPLYVPQSDLDAYRDRPIPEPTPVPEHPVANTRPIKDRTDPTGEELKRHREAYMAAVTLIDRHLGRILDALEDADRLENTLILFTSDHGEMLGDRGLFQKHVPYDGSARVPMIAAGPHVEAGAIVETPTITYDVSATILAAAGVEPEQAPDLLGRDLRHQLPSDRIVVVHHAEGGSRYLCAIDSEFKFVHWLGGGAEELYNLRTDPGEQINLIHEPRMSAIAERLRDAAIAFEADHGQAENARDGKFVDAEPSAYDDMSLGRYPRWSGMQFPKWPCPITDEDRQAMLAEMRHCLSQPTARVYADDDYRQYTIWGWEHVGGDPAAIQALFDQADAEGKGA